jgi:hypothetical protein
MWLDGCNAILRLDTRAQRAEDADNLLCPSVRPSVCLSIRLPVRPSACLSIWSWLRAGRPLCNWRRCGGPALPALGHLPRRRQRHDHLLTLRQCSHAERSQPMTAAKPPLSRQHHQKPPNCRQTAAQPPAPPKTAKLPPNRRSATKNRQTGAKPPLSRQHRQNRQKPPNCRPEMAAPAERHRSRATAVAARNH